MVLRELHRSEQHDSRFTRSSIWRGFLLNTEEKHRIDRLMGTALLDDATCELLVNKRDVSLMASFGLSLETQDWLQSIQAGSLEELAQEIALVA